MKKNLCVSIILWLTALAAVLSACMAAGARSSRAPQDSAAVPASEPGSCTQTPVVVMPSIQTDPPCSDTMPVETSEPEPETTPTETPEVVMPSVTPAPSVSVSMPEETTEPETVPTETSAVTAEPSFPVSPPTEATEPKPESERPLPTLPGSTAALWDAARADGFPADADCTPAQFLEKWLTVEGLSLPDLDKHGCRQLVLTAAQAAGVTTLTTCYEKGDDGVWHPMGSLLELPGWVGANGIAHDRRRYTDTSPAGLWALGMAFGNEERPDGLLLPWRDVTPQSDWVCDADSPYFNTWQERGASAQDDDWDYDEAEHLADYPNQYAWACVIAYNLPPDPIPDRGCAIFLHCAKGPTEGCVGLHRADMLSVLKWLDADQNPYILITGTEHAGLRNLFARYAEPSFL